MADCSLDDYIKQKGIAFNTKRVAAGKVTAGSKGQVLPRNGNRNNVQPKKAIAGRGTTQQRFDARQILSSSNTKPIGRGSQNAGVAPRIGGPVAQKVSVTSRIGGVKALNASTAPQNVSDARLRIMAKTKFMDARQRIVNKRKLKETVAAATGVQERLDGNRGIIVGHQFIQQPVQCNPGTLTSPQQMFFSQTSVLPSQASTAQPWGNSFDGSIVKTINYPVFNVQNPVPEIPNLVSMDVFTPPLFQKNASIRVTMLNDQHKPDVGLQQRASLQTVPVIQKTFPVATAVEQRPIPTVVSQPPVRVVGQGPVRVVGQGPVRVVGKPTATDSMFTKPPNPALPSAETSKKRPLSGKEGFRVMITNLHPNVSQDDVIELFGAVGTLKHARLIKPGFAEAFYPTKENAMQAVSMYHRRELDDQPMNVVMEEEKKPPMDGTLALGIRDCQPLRYTVKEEKKPTDGTLALGIRDCQPLRLNKAVPRNVVELEPSIIHKALFKTSTEHVPVKPVNFTVHM